MDHVEHQGEVVALAGMPGVDVALQPVVRRAVTVTLDRLSIANTDAIKLGALEQQGANAVYLRTVGIFLGLDLGVMLAMHRHPLPCHLAGGEPQPQTEEMRDDWMQFHGPVGHGTVKINGDPGDGDVGHHQNNQEISPNGQFD